MLRLTVYGGVAGDEQTGEIGGNKVLLEYEDRAWLFDFGTRFSVLGRYFEEFLKPRSSTLGLRDHLRMGLLPPIEGIYRADLQSHEPDLWERYRDHPAYHRLERLDGVLLSHAHMDHNGCIGFLEPEIPTFTGLMTAVIAKGMQDTRSGGPDAELCYLAPREADGDVLKSVRGQRLGRPHHVCDDPEKYADPMRELADFWGDVPGPRTGLEAPPLRWADRDGLGIRFFRVDHSIPGSGAFALETPAGWVVYTGDLRRHGHSSWRTEKFAEEAAGLSPAVLIVEGTNLDPEPATEEPEVHEAAAEVVAAEPGLVIADFSPRNIERLRTFHDIARDQGRRLVVTTRDAYLLGWMHVIDPEIPRPDTEPLAVLREPAGQRHHWERGVLGRCERTVVDAAAIRRDPGDYILCLSFFDITNLIDLEPEGGTYIYSSSEAHNEEQVIDQARLRAWIEHFGLSSVGGLPGAEQGPFHASGHIDGPAMEWLIETIDPGIIVPVHTQQLGWFQERWPERVHALGYGESVHV